VKKPGVFVSRVFSLIELSAAFLKVFSPGPLAGYSCFDLAKVENT